MTVNSKKHFSVEILKGIQARSHSAATMTNWKVSRRKGPKCTAAQIKEAKFIQELTFRPLMCLHQSQEVQRLSSS